MEERYVAVLRAECPPATWRRICRRAVADALEGDHRARQWLGVLLLGDELERRVAELEAAQADADADRAAEADT